MMWMKEIKEWKFMPWNNKVLKLISECQYFVDQHRLRLLALVMHMCDLFLIYRRPNKQHSVNLQPKSKKNIHTCMKKKACKKTQIHYMIFSCLTLEPRGIASIHYRETKSIHNSYFVISHVKNDFEYQVSNNVIIIKRVNRKLGCKAKPCHNLPWSVCRL